MEVDKEEFLKEFGRDYGYPNGPRSIDEIRATEFKRLDQNGLVYLDHAGATLYSELQMEAIFKDLNSRVYGNPHSQSEASSATLEIVREARQQVLDYCNASPKDYKCIFTSGATAALKLIGEAFPWNHESNFMYTMENHNSVLGIREYALSQGAAAFAVDIESPVHHDGIKVSLHPVQRRYEAEFMEGEPMGDAYNLFAFPSECNFSGFRFSLELVKLIKDNSERILGGSQFCKGSWMVLIDAAKGCATQPPDLSKYPADFVVISFYKLFGYPTGLGALIVRNDAAKILKKNYFSGGTVAASFADVDFVKRRESVEELFEDGTISFLSIASMCHGFKILNSLTAPRICRHTASLTMYVEKMLLALRHENGAKVCMIYKSHASKVLCCESGSILSFNLKRPDGSWFGYREVEKLASLSGIQLRTGCFCNPGACAKYLGLSHLDLLSNLEAGHVCWDDNDIIQGKPTGAVRVSFGYMSTYEDAKKFIDFITRSFVSTPNKSANGNLFRPRSIPFSSDGQEKRHSSAGYYLKSITIFPIKSCGGFSVESWPLSSAGLQHDREWLLKSLTGEILTQKKVPEMCFISTSIDLNQGLMLVESPRCKAKLKINLRTDSYPCAKEEIELHAKRFEVQHCENDVNLWFSNAVGRPCTLLRCSSSKGYVCRNENRAMSMCRDVESRLSFANEAQFLLISEESISDLNNRLSQTDVQKGTHGTSLQVNPMRFRPNLVISGGEPYAEDGWRSLKIGNKSFTSLGGCNRCQMINFVHRSGQVQRSNEPLATLATYRRVKGKILFGILLRYENSDKTGLLTDSCLQVGQEVNPDSEKGYTKYKE
ncbi:molybdenum cofactor sulfurase isoform X1 [Hevea brasiliensis]|uniref:molybdenum cofactor sulfurase isoform X1 n=1 Tax=Hevea brasiliensis TaxID=3981 RepID=UPI0025DFEB19|nr:molybdenum cofactor sulfurase isoform X1 [Hevea brasiliensis]